MFNELEQQTTLPIISEGDTGEDVIILQSELKDLKYYFTEKTACEIEEKRPRPKKQQEKCSCSMPPCTRRISHRTH